MTDKTNNAETRFVTSGWAGVPNVHRFAHQAMATTFEVIVQYEDQLYARQAASAAFAELDRIEGELSRYVETSDIVRVNHLPAGRPLPLGLDAFECLVLSAQIHDQTGGAFDVTVGLLVDCWLDQDRKLRTPSQEELQFAREHTGMERILFDEATHAIALTHSPLRVDLGGVGKGYGVDRMAEMLREWSIDRALIHGGFSSVLALDAPSGLKGWPVTLSHPQDRHRTLARLDLERMAVGGSGVEKGRHIIDPRVARPAEGKLAAWSIAPDAARADALSTAFMVMTSEQVRDYCARHGDVRGLLIATAQSQDGPAQTITPVGNWPPGQLQR